MKRQGETLKASLKKAICILYGPKYMTFSKRQNCEDSEKISGCQGQRGGRNE